MCCFTVIAALKTCALHHKYRCQFNDFFFLHLKSISKRLIQTIRTQTGNTVSIILSAFYVNYRQSQNTYLLSIL